MATKTAQIGTRIAPDGTETTLTPKNGKEFDLSELQAAVGGYIERVPAKGVGHATVYADEEGLCKGLTPNPKASALVGYGPLVGPVLIVRRA